MKRLIILVLSALSFASFAQDRYGVVGLSAVMMRENPSYTAELGNQALMGTVVKIVDSESYWLKIVSPDPYTAWTTNMGIVQMSEDQLEEYILADKYIVQAESSHVYREPSLKSQRITDLVAGDLLLVGEGRGGGFNAVALPSGEKGWVKSGDVLPFRHWAESVSCTAGNVLSWAYKMLGVPYFWGGNTIKGADCSGLVSLAFFMNGVLVPRNASQQAKVGEDIDIEGVASGDFSKLKSGDLLFFGADKGKISHVGIYIGEGYFIHSSHLVRINSLDKTADDYYSSKPVVAVRRLIDIDSQDNGLTTILSSPYYFKQAE